MVEEVSSKFFMKIGFMQGRLSYSNGKIQEFPYRTWGKEFKIAYINNYKIVEWTIDTQTIKKNPLIKKKTIFKILSLKKKYKIKIKTLTCDYVMQKPFWNMKDNKKKIYYRNFVKIIDHARDIGIKKIIVPLVDNSSLKNKQEEKKLIFYMKSLEVKLKKNNQQILFEIDYSPFRTKKFIEKFNTSLFGINYDTGNSAGLGYDSNDEFKYYGKYIKNIHLKDKFLNGETVRLGLGDADFKKIFKNIKKIKYKDNLILQTARSKNGKHVDELNLNYSFLNKILKELNYERITK